MTDINGVVAEELEQYIEQYEQLASEKKDVSDRQKEVMTAAKGAGYDTKILRKIIALRKKSRDDRQQEEAVLELYKNALKMD